MRTQAVIIKKTATNEYDQLVTCFTREYGKLTAIAKGSLKSSSLQSMQLNVFNIVEFELVNGRSMPIIAAAECVTAYHGIRQSLPSLAATYFFMEVADRMIFDMQSDEALWDFLTGLLHDLHTAPASLDMFRKKQAELLGILGYQPHAIDPTLSAVRYSPLDAQFEQTAQSRFSSLPFLYSVLK